MPEPIDMGPYGSLWDWRRRVASLYEAVRSCPEPKAAWMIWRRERDALFRQHAQSPVEADRQQAFQGLPYLPYDPSLRFLVELRQSDGPDLTIDAAADGLIRLHGFARTLGLETAMGRELTLFWVGGYGGGVFLPFADATNGSLTYGGGRYLLDTIKGADLGTTPTGLTVLDFNFAYNPSCSYSPRYVCPLAPVENRVTVPIHAGETVARS